MARPTPTTTVLCATAAGLGALFVAVRVLPEQSDFSELLQPVVHAATPAPMPAAPAAAASSPVAVPAPAASGAALGLSLGRRDRTIPSPSGDAFARLNWQPPPPPPPPAPPPPPPPPPAAPAAAPAPVAPPLPFTFVGIVEQGAGKPQAFLSKGDALLIVSAGDLIENNTYRIDSLSATSVVLTYVPMGKQQTINVSGGSK